MSPMVALISSVAVATEDRFVVACSIPAATEAVLALISSAAVATVAALALVPCAPLDICPAIADISVDDEARVAEFSRTSFRMFCS